MDNERLQDLVDRILQVVPSGRRSLIAIAGPPASGKSRLARNLVGVLKRSGASATLVPMDGFHLDNAILQSRDLLARKGAPETFDAQGFVHAIRRLKQEDEVILPTFDRARDLSVAGAIAIGPEHRIAVVEGNYLCFGEPPWNALADLWDWSVYLDVPEPVLLERLVRRWIKFGHTPEEAEQRAKANDLPNALRVQQASAGYDLAIAHAG